MTDSDKEWLLGVLNAVVGASEKRLHTRLDAIELRVSRLEEELPAALERLETKLLTAFHSWASPMEMRVRSHTAVLNALDLEIEAIKSKFNPNPPH